MPAHTGLEMHMKPWLRLESSTHADPRVRKARAGAVWPWVLCRLKDGDGFVDSHDLDPWAAADACGIPEDLAAAQLDGLRAVGLLVETPDGWTTPAWDRHQPDPTNSDRQKRFRERNAKARKLADEAVTDTAPDGGQRWDTVTVTNGYVTSRNGSNARRDGTRQDMTAALPEIGQNPGRSRSPDDAPARTHERAHERAPAHEGLSHDNDDHGEDPIQAEQERRDRAMLRAAHERRQANASPTALAASQTPAAVTVDPDMAAAFTAWRRTDAGAAPLSSAVVDKMRRVIAEHGAARVIKAIDAWVGTANGTKFATVNYIVGACKGIANDEAEAEARAAERERWQAEEEERRREEEERREEYAHLTPEQRAANIEMVQGLFAEMDRLLSGRSPRAVATH